MNKKKKRSLSNITWQVALPYVLLIGGVIGLLASLSLAYDTVHVLENPGFRPNCDLNPVLSCVSEMSSKQASILGVPNPFFGLIIFSMLIMFGLVIFSGAVLRRWLWQCAQLASTAGVIFMHYLFFEAVFRIHSICPWCFVVWMITISIFFGVTVFNIRMDNLGLSKYKITKKLAYFIDKHTNDILIFWYLVILGILIVRFWYYWKTLI